MDAGERRNVGPIERITGPFAGYVTVSILSGEILRLLLLNLDPDRLLDTYLDPASDGVCVPVLSLLLGLLPLSLLSIPTSPSSPSPLPPRLLDLDFDRLPDLDFDRLRLTLRSLPSIASSNKDFRGPISPSSSRTSRFVRRGRMISQTRSEVRSWSMKESKWVIV